MACLAIPDLTAKLQSFLGMKPKNKLNTQDEKESRPATPLQISAPFDFKHESIILPGAAGAEFHALKRKALADVYRARATAAQQKVHQATIVAREAEVAAKQAEIASQKAELAAKVAAEKDAVASGIHGKAAKTGQSSEQTTAPGIAVSSSIPVLPEIAI
ncbi:hypothetical protein GGR50DRAFT_330830 [Xylaria sp. CBS 124048]|nr:hypothetical protein GGR50DRAFT_330830 [Xylaria sp. CBS 124048]